MESPSFQWKNGLGIFEYVPEGLDAATNTSHQLRSGFKKKGWPVSELSDRVFLIEPHVDASLLDSILEEGKEVKIYAFKPDINLQYQSLTIDLIKGLENPLIQ